jgi:hypothetical protein
MGKHGIGAARSHRRGIAQFTASLTADTADSQPTMRAARPSASAVTGCGHGRRRGDQSHVIVRQVARAGFAASSPDAGQSTAPSAPQRVASDGLRCGASVRGSRKPEQCGNVNQHAARKDRNEPHREMWLAISPSRLKRLTMPFSGFELPSGRTLLRFPLC